MRLTLIDLSSLAYPIWHMAGNDPDPDAVSTQLVARVRALGDDHTALCCDSGRSFRNDVSAEYKANRKPEERAVLYHQIDVALDRLRGDGFPIWTAKGFEADDVIASATNLAIEGGHDVLIVSADKDLLQLVSDPHVTAKSLKTGDIIDEGAVKVRFGVLPSQMRDWLTIVGDVSDNVKGVAGIGERGATDLLTKFGSLDNVYDLLDVAGKEHAIKPSQVLALKAFAPRFQQVRTLITLRTDAEIPFDEILQPRTPKDVPPMVDEDPPVPDDIDESLPTVPPAGVPAWVPVVPPPTVPDTLPALPSPATTTHNKMTVVPPSHTNGEPVDWKTQLEPTTMAEASFLANRAFESKLFSAYGTPQAVLMTLVAGRELGLTAMASLRALHVIDGKPTMSADLMRALVLRSGALKYFRCVERTSTKATWEAQRGDDPPVTLTFTIEDAQMAGVVKPNSGWVKFPADMLTARASAKLARLVCPDVCHGIYLPEEIRENQ